MEEQEFDDTIVQDILDWLSRNVEVEDENPGSGLVFTEEDNAFLRALGIAVPF